MSCDLCGRSVSAYEYSCGSVCHSAAKIRRSARGPRCPARLQKCALSGRVVAKLSTKPCWSGVGRCRSLFGKRKAGLSPLGTALWQLYARGRRRADYPPHPPRLRHLEGAAARQCVYNCPRRAMAQRLWALVAMLFGSIAPAHALVANMFPKPMSPSSTWNSTAYLRQYTLFIYVRART